ncbi:formimidoylglutamate deiminase [Embleya sp. NPDC050154]|uniref:formimidoylglutamate deiminase n=1 Tax=Embleya sp. NPDC050154 TaxID=3363988 RepID=UPI003796E2C5
MSEYWCELVQTRTGIERDALLVVEDGRIASVTPDRPAPGGACVLPGLTIPGLANVHSHAFHRALRGRTQTGTGTFWTWRDQMYQAAGRLDPDSYLALARAVYAEMALAGITSVGEFHYLHHGPDGTPYDDPNAMGHALIEAAREAGVRITLLDTCYLHGGLTADGYRPLEGVQRRFGDGSSDAWYERWGALRGDDNTRIGAAIHSVRAFDTKDGYATWAARTEGVPVHVHLSEQPAENAACVAHHGLTPTGLLDAHGFWSANATAVHATHLTDADIAALARAEAGVCFCPTTERDLADGIGPAGELARAGVPLSLGSDSQAVIDLFEEARAVELDERLRTGRRGHFTSAALLAYATGTGHRALGWPDAGRIEPGALADLTTIGLDSVRLAGTVPRLATEAAVFAATASDVTHVMVGGRTIVRDGVHQLVEAVPQALGTAIHGLFG